MYVPEILAVAEEAYAHEVIDDHGFALLVTAADGPPQTSRLPFLLAPEIGPKGTLAAHMARANPQWRSLERLSAQGGEALVII